MMLSGKALVIDANQRNEEYWKHKVRKDQMHYRLTSRGDGDVTKL